MESFFSQPASWLTLLGTFGLSLVGFLANKYVIPFLKVGQREKYAEYIAAIADDVTDELRLKYPAKTWLTHLDEAIDRLIAICGIDHEIAGRAVRAAAARK